MMHHIPPTINLQLSLSLLIYYYKIDSFYESTPIHKHLHILFNTTTESAGSSSSYVSYTHSIASCTKDKRTG